MITFTLERGEFEDGKGKCPYDPAKGHTGLLVGEYLPLVQRGQIWDLVSHIPDACRQSTSVPYFSSLVNRRLSPVRRW